MPSHAITGDLKVYPEELQAYESYLKMKDVESRKLVQGIIDKDQNSPVAWYILGLLTREDEGNTTRALFYFNKSIEFAEQQCGTAPLSPQCVKWHSMAFQDKIEALKSLDRPQDAIQAINEYDKIYVPKLDAERIWPLIKMRKLDEAEMLAKRILREANPKFKTSALNSLCVLASERGKRVASDVICMEASSQSQSMVIHYNTAISKLSIFDFQGAEQYARKASNLPNDMYGSAWEFLIYLYTNQERFAEALSAAKNAAEDHRSFGALKEELSRTHYLNGISQMLLALGRLNNAYQISKQSHEEPDRTGKISGNPAFDELINNIYHAVSIQAYLLHLQEIAPTQTWLERGKNFAAYLESSLKLLTLKRKIRTLAQDKELLARLLIPYPPALGPLENIPFWYHFFLIDLVGSGPMQAALHIAEQNDTELKPQNKLYYDMLRFLIESKQAAAATTIQSGQILLSKLPPQEALLQSLVKTYLIQTYLEQNQMALANSMISDLIRQNPLFLRLMQIPIAVKLDIASDNISQQAAKLLKRTSPWYVAKQGIYLQISSQGENLYLCLQDQNRNQIFCSTQKIDPKKINENITQAVLTFNQDALSPKVDLSQIDVNTLNGTPTKGSASESIQNLLQTP